MSALLDAIVLTAPKSPEEAREVRAKLIEYYPWASMVKELENYVVILEQVEEQIRNAPVSALKGLIAKGKEAYRRINELLDRIPKNAYTMPIVTRARAVVNKFSQTTKEVEEALR